MRFKEIRLQQDLWIKKLNKHQQILNGDRQRVDIPIGAFDSPEKIMAEIAAAESMGAYNLVLILQKKLEQLQSNNPQ